MGSSAREKAHRGAARKGRHSAKPHVPPAAGAGADPKPQIAATTSSSFSCPSSACSVVPPSLAASDYAGGVDQHPSPNPCGPDEVCAAAAAAAGWIHFTDDQLEDLLLKKLESVYRDALSRLVAMGYEEALALQGIMSNGHYNGTMDMFSNLIRNAVAYINSKPPQDPAAMASGRVGGCSPEPAAFSNMRYLEFSLARLVCFLQQVRPELSRRDTMWCLLIADLHVGRASSINPPSSCSCSCSSSSSLQHSQDCKSRSQCESFDPTLTTKSLLMRHASALPSAFNGSRAPANTPPSSGQLQELAEDKNEGPHEPRGSQDSDLVESVLKSLEEMRLEEGGKEPQDGEDQKESMIKDLCKQIKDLEVQLNERKDWAQKKALQAARRLSNDQRELKVLRMERQENQRLDKGKQAMEDPTVKHISELEAVLRKTSGQSDRANAEVRRLEAENAEIRADMQASKLSTDESVASCLDASKKEKKCLKKLAALEKQRDKIQAEIAEYKKQSAQIERHLREVKETSKEAEMKWKLELKAKEQAMSQAEEERRAKEAAETNIARRHDTLRHKIDLDFQRQRDDVQRLNEELSRLKALAGSAARLSGAAPPPPNILDANAARKTGRPADLKAPSGGGGGVGNKLQEPLPSQKTKRDHRLCMICTKEEVRLVFLPCAHQVVCVRCNDELEKCKKTCCPFCNSQIEQRIRVFGPTS